MKHPLLIYGLHYNLTIIFLFVVTLYSSAQVKSYRKLNIDSLEVNIVSGKFANKLNDTVSLEAVFSDIVNKSLIIKDTNTLNLLTDNRNWHDNIYTDKIDPFKTGQFAIEKNNHFIFICDGSKLIRIPISLESINNINSIQLIPSSSPPKGFREGTIYFDKVIGRLRYFDGKKWRKL
ncbi:MAG: hypothetical protein ABR927_07510 [Bacteroidales bacterium]